MAENVLSTVQVTFVHEATISAIQLLKVVSCIKGFCLIRKDRMAKSIWVKGDRQEKGLLAILKMEGHVCLLQPPLSSNVHKDGVGGGG